MPSLQNIKMLGAKGINHEYLYKLISSNAKYSLIDVRDQDFGAGGFIKSAIHIDSHLFTSEIAEKLIRDGLLNKVTDIICYCSFGRARSVQCAQLLNEIALDMVPIPQIDISYLKGGFKMFKAWYSETPLIIPHIEPSF